MKKIAILSKNYNSTVNSIVTYLKEIKCDYFTNVSEINTINYDLIISCNGSCDIKDFDCIGTNILAVHHSLLPSFSHEEPAKQVFLEEVKVTGISIFFTKPFKIISQYPIFIYNSTHFDELERELEYVEQILLPLVIEKVLNNEAFETKNLISKSQNCIEGSCSSCSKCSGGYSCNQ